MEQPSVPKLKYFEGPRASEVGRSDVANSPELVDVCGSFSVPKKVHVGYFVLQGSCMPIPPPNMIVPPPHVRDTCRNDMNTTSGLHVESVSNSIVTTIGNIRVPEIILGQQVMDDNFSLDCTQN